MFMSTTSRVLLLTRIHLPRNNRLGYKVLVGKHPSLIAQSVCNEEKKFCDIDETMPMLKTFFSINDIEVEII
jgi:hypothetical protein